MTVTLAFLSAPSPAAAAEYYPAIYWFSMIHVPAENQFPGTAQNGFEPGMGTQGHMLDVLKTNGCVTCHQLGNKATRTIPETLGKFATAWPSSRNASRRPRG